MIAIAQVDSSALLLVLQVVKGHQVALDLVHHINVVANAGAIGSEATTVRKNGLTIAKLCNLCAVE